MQCPSTNNSIIGLINEYTTIMVQMAKIKLLSRTNFRHLDGITHYQNITKYEMPNLYTARNLLIINKKLFPNTNLGCIMILDHHSRLSVFCRKTIRPVLQAVKLVLESGQTGLMYSLDRSIQEHTLASTNIGL